MKYSRTSNIGDQKSRQLQENPKIRQYFLVAKLFGGKAVLIGTKITSTKNVPLQCTRCSVSFKKVEY